MKNGTQKQAQQTDREQRIALLGRIMDSMSNEQLHTLLLFMLHFTDYKG